MSADTHKYGFAPKGTSVVLYRSPRLRRYQYYTQTDWPGGLYLSPTMAGSRPGALSVACWATMVSMGEAGYLEATQRILTAADYIRRSLEIVPGLEVIGHPLWILALRSREFNIYRLLDLLAQRGWSLNGLHRPPAIHLAVTLRHAEPGVAQRFVTDVWAAVEEVRATPKAKGGMAPVYGMAGSLPLRGVVKDLLDRYLDALYTLPSEPGAT
jgi:glutamate/tyrosine decarboxylase-like PLP-dependent enzyme